MLLTGLLFRAHFSDPLKSQVEKWHQWKVPIMLWNWGTKIAPTIDWTSLWPINVV